MPIKIFFVSCFFVVMPSLSYGQIQNILFFGDQGDPKPATFEIARQMLTVCKLSHGCSYGLSAGDNIYSDGVFYDPESDWEQKFVKHFVSIFKPLWEEYNMPFYMSLGNHDVGITTAFNQDIEYFWRFGKKLEAAHFQKERVLRMRSQTLFSQSPHNPKTETSRMWNLPAYYYSQLLEFSGLKTYLVVFNTNTYSGSLLESPDGTPFNSNQENWLREKLRSQEAQSADWRIVLSHHPVYSIGRHGVNNYFKLHKIKAAANDTKGMEELRDKLAPILCSHRVNFLLAGHDHHLEVDMIPCPDNSAVLQVISGAASKKTVGHFYEKSPYGANAFTFRGMPEHFIWANGLNQGDLEQGQPAEAMHGFSFIKLSKHQAKLEMIKKGENGPEWLQCWDLNRDGSTFTKKDLSKKTVDCPQKKLKPFDPSTGGIPKLVEISGETHSAVI